MSKIEVNEIAARSGTNISMTSGHTIQPNFHSNTTFPAGHVLQVKQTYFQTEANFSGSGAFVSDIYLDCSITPTSSSSKILVQVMLNYSCSTAGCGNGIGLDRVIGGATTANIARGTAGSTADFWIGLNNNYDQSNSGGLMMNAFGSYLDSPNTTSAITYKPKFWFVGGTTPIKMNRSNSGNHGAPSTTTLMEIAG